VTDLYGLTMKTIDGKDQPLAAYRGKTLLVVNVASECGLTPQYAALQGLQREYGDRGLEVLGFPCNQFGGQEPGTEADVKAFCTTRYGVTFPMFSKIDVNGPRRVPLYQWLTSQPTQPDGPGDIGWNFAKFLVDRTGRVAARFAPQTAPGAPEVRQAIERALAG
jgi:glutathione peroxidase